MKTRNDKTITIELLPNSQGGNDLRLDDFLQELDAVKAALRETERLVSDREPSLFFTIKRLQKNSPALVELEAESPADEDESRPQFAGFVVRSLTTNLRVIGTRNRPRKIDVPTLSSYQEMLKPLEKHGLEVIVKSGTDEVKLDKQFQQAIAAVMGEDEVSYGSLSGRIEAMTTHSQNKFRLYPVVGAPRISGFFARKNRAKFTAGMDKYVTVVGRIKYKTWDKFPYAIWADDIEIHDLTGPTLMDLRGVAPHATGSLSTQEFLEDLRDE